MAQDTPLIWCLELKNSSPLRKQPPHELKEQSHHLVTTYLLPTSVAIVSVIFCHHNLFIPLQIEARYREHPEFSPPYHCTTASLIYFQVASANQGWEIHGNPLQMVVNWQGKSGNQRGILQPS